MEQNNHTNPLLRSAVKFHICIRRRTGRLRTFRTHRYSFQKIFSVKTFIIQDRISVNEHTQNRRMVNPALLHLICQFSATIQNNFIIHNTSS